LREARFTRRSQPIHSLFIPAWRARCHRLPSMSTARPLKSLLAQKHVAPLVILVAVAVAVAQCSGSFDETFALFLILGAIPTLGVTVVAALLARRRWKGSLIATGATFAAHIALAIVLVPEGRWRGTAILVAIACCGIGFLVAVPVLLATAAFAHRRDDGMGDQLLGVGAAWFACVELGLLAYDAASRLTVVLGLFAAAIVIGFTLVRARRRRSFCMRVARGELAGVRARYVVASDALALLPIVYGPAEDALTVIEELAIVDDAYRGTTIGVPVALAPSKYAEIADHLGSSHRR
jgi:hypothetical protein